MCLAVLGACVRDEEVCGEFFGCVWVIFREPERYWVASTPSIFIYEVYV